MPSLSGQKTIVLKGEGGVYQEGPLAAAASPGMNVVMTAAVDQSGRDTYTPGATDAAAAGTTTAASAVKILREDALQGRTVDTPYAAGDNGFVYVPRPGDHLLVLVASGQTVAKGGGLAAVASGKWNGVAVGRVAESLEDSGGALAADTLLRARVL
jgi:biotin carboxyl carrier protein